MDYSLALALVWVFLLLTGQVSNYFGECGLLVIGAMFIV